MVTPVTLPKLGYEMEQATLAAWLKQPGDMVTLGEVIAEIETDKAIVELEAEADGTLLAIAAEVGAIVPVGAAIAYLGEPGEQTPAFPTIRASGNQPTQFPAAPESSMRAGYPPRAPGADGRIELGRMGEAIARRTERTAAEAPMFHLTVRVDMTEALELRRELRARDQARVSVNDMIIKACAIALLAHPVYNSTFEGDHLRVRDRVSIGIAVALPGGLAVPAVPDCDRKSLAEIAAAARDLTDRAKSGKLRPDEYTGTFSISNLGMFQVDAFNAIIVSPQVGVLAVGSISPTPVVKGGEVVVRQMMSATLTTDHRAAHGAEAAQFTGEIKRLLEEPRLLLD